MSILKHEILNQTAELAKDLIEGMGSLLFPGRCAGCKRIDRPCLCGNCLSKLEWIDPDQGCARCGEMLDVRLESNMALCRRCRANPPDFVHAISALRYVQPLNKAVAEWKYHDQRYLCDSMSGLLSEWVAGHKLEWWDKIQVIVPVPHHLKTMRDRGFSPPEDLASNFAHRMGIPCMTRAVYKVRFTAPQAGLSGSARIDNLKYSMKVFDRELVNDRSLLVIDDVMTTGATLRESARALVEAGASGVYCLTLARQSGGMA